MGCGFPLYVSKSSYGRGQYASKKNFQKKQELLLTLYQKSVIIYSMTVSRRSQIECLPNATFRSIMYGIKERAGYTSTGLTAFDYKRIASYDVSECSYDRRTACRLMWKSKKHKKDAVPYT